MSRQLLLFPDDKDQVYREIDTLSKSIEKVRRGVFRRTTELSSKVSALEEEIEALKHQIWILEGYIKREAL